MLLILHRSQFCFLKIFAFDEEQKSQLKRLGVAKMFLCDSQGNLSVICAMLCGF